MAGIGYGYGYVSIHAPVWGATPQVKRTKADTVVSIHAPVWGATQAVSTLMQALSFNPRTRVGCDKRYNSTTTTSSVSIHAPVWGATAYLVTDSYYN